MRLILPGQLVDAYAHVKKCNNEGRALMTRDVKVLANLANNPQDAVAYWLLLGWRLLMAAVELCRD